MTLAPGIDYFCEHCPLWSVERIAEARVQSNARDNVTPPIGLIWADVEREALHCPVLQRMWHLDAMDSQLTREQVMIWTLLWFSRNRREMMDREVERLMNEPARVTSPPPLSE